jgi:4-hydroxy-3-polyprenylbenzoate decarboxylase
MVVDKKTLTLSGQLLRDVVKNEKKGQSTPVAIVMGMDPLLTLASGSPVHVDEDGNMEYEAAGAWRGHPTELVKCETNDLLVPAQAEYVIEGEIALNTRMQEGPHGEAGGFYGQNLDAFPVTISCITHRKNPITYGIICLLEEDYPRWLFRSGAFQDRLKAEKGMECVKEAFFPELGGRGWGGAIISADIQDPDAPRRIIEAAWRVNANRWVILVDDDCDLRNWNDVMWRVVTNVRNGEDIFKGKATNRVENPQQPKSTRAREMDIDSDIPDPTGINASFKFKFQYLPPINKSSRDYMAKVASRWGELGLP